MAAKAIFVLCVQTFLIQSALGRCIEPLVVPATRGCGSFVPAASTGGSFVVTSASPVAPTGITIVSDNVYEGALVAGGSLPLLGSVGVEGEFSTAGAGAVSYGCGDGAAAIVNEEGPIVTGIVGPIIAAPIAFAPGYAAPYLGYGISYGVVPGFYGYYGNGCSYF